MISFYPSWLICQELPRLWETWKDKATSEGQGNLWRSREIQDDEVITAFITGITSSWERAGGFLDPAPKADHLNSGVIFPCRVRGPPLEIQDGRN
jgi:hypothetical protein